MDGGGERDGGKPKPLLSLSLSLSPSLKHVEGGLSMVGPRKIANHMAPPR